MAVVTCGVAPEPGDGQCLAAAGADLLGWRVEGEEKTTQWSEAQAFPDLGQVLAGDRERNERSAELPRQPCRHRCCFQHQP